MIKKGRWLKEELDFVIDHYRDYGPNLVSETLNRTKGSVKSMAAELGVNRKQIKKDLKPGYRFGQLTIISHSHDNNYAYYYNCLCDCGKSAIICQRNMGATKSCGCLQKKTASEKNKIEPGENGFNTKFRSYKIGAKKRKIEFFLTIEQFKEIIIKDCFHCGKPPRDYNIYYNSEGKVNNCHKNKILDLTIQESWIKVNGIDRLDNNEGYTMQNSVPCCTFCNESKNDRTKLEFYENIERVYKFQQAKQGLVDLGVTFGEEERKRGDEPYSSPLG